MPETQLAAPLFIKEIFETAVDTAQTPFFFNDGGAPTYLSQPQRQNLYHYHNQNQAL